MPSIGLIVTGSESLKELQIFAKSLEIWHPDAVLYVATDRETQVETIKFKGEIKVKRTLDDYVGKRRYEMESLPGKHYKDLWTDFMYEKAKVIEWMFDAEVKEAWFLDADITFLAPLPDIPETATLALSPHYIRECDTKRFGYYNAGFLCMRNRKYLEEWKKAGLTSRFYEQAALETIAESAKLENTLYEFPIQVNFGWWRMFQSVLSPPTILSKFSIFRKEQSVGIRYDGKALQSVHTHWNDKGEYGLQAFNNSFRTLLKKFINHPPIKVFCSSILS